MKKTCSTCAFWKRKTGEFDKNNTGNCDCEMFIYIIYDHGLDVVPDSIGIMRGMMLGFIPDKISGVFIGKKSPKTLTKNKKIWYNICMKNSKKYLEV